MSEPAQEYQVPGHSRTRRLAIVLALNLSLVASLVIVGLAAHSLAVLAAGVDYLADAAAIGGSLFAIRLASRPPSRARPAAPARTAIPTPPTSPRWLTPAGSSS
ncbi:MAG: cation transporter [Streptosporangiaceae bacterium]